MIYETAVQHPKFRNGDWVIINSAMTKEDAQKVHNEMVEFMRNKPNVLYDIYEDEYFMYMEVNNE